MGGQSLCVVWELTGGGGKLVTARLFFDLKRSV